MFSLKQHLQRVEYKQEHSLLFDSLHGHTMIVSACMFLKKHEQASKFLIILKPVIRQVPWEGEAFSIMKGKSVFQQREKLVLQSMGYSHDTRAVLSHSPSE